MNIKRMEETKKILDRCVDNNEYGGCLRLLYKNNDFLETCLCESYIDVMELGKMIIQVHASETLSCDYTKIYNDIIGETQLFIESHYDKTVISWYLAIACMLEHKTFCGKEKINTGNDYYDIFKLSGLDVILGKACCRHNAAVFKDIMKKYFDVKILDVGEEENERGNHVILCVKDNKRLFLDSTSSNIYYPFSNFELLGFRGKRYIKSTHSYVYELDFDNIFAFYSFFNNLYANSKMSNSEWDGILDKMIETLTAYEKERGMLDEFSLKLEPYRQKIRKLL